MGFDAGEVLSAVAGLGLGTAASAAAASELVGLGQAVRERAFALAREVDELARQSGSAQQGLATCEEIPWKGQAAEAFRLVVHERQLRQGQCSEDLSNAAETVRLAGEALAAELDALAGSISAAGRAVESALRQAASSLPELSDVTDLLRDHSVVFAQSQLDSLMDQPLVSSVKRALA